VVDWKEAKRLLTDIEAFPEYCERFLMIQPVEGGRLIPLKLNRVQRYVLDRYVIPKFRAGEPCRLVILKGRQHGITTMFNALNQRLTMGNSHWNSLLVGEDRDQARTIFRIVKRFNQHMPWGQDPPDISLFPHFPQIGDSADCIEFNRPPVMRRGRKYRPGPNTVFLDSRIEIKSAEKEDALGVGGFYHSVHASEAARWPKLALSLSKLLQCCHPEPGTLVCVECTANGYNEFQSFWSNLKIGQLEVPSYWQKVFLPWYWKDEYEFPLDIPQRFADDYEEWFDQHVRQDEQLRQIDPQLTDERIWAKIFWRRRKIRDDFFGDVDLFKQEFPATDSEAFIFSGASVYAATSLERLERKVSNDCWQGNVSLLRAEGDTEEVLPSVVHREEHERGYLKVWEEPEEFHRYAVFADIAEGKALEGIPEEKSKWDFSCAQLFKVTSWPPAMKQVAVWHGNCDPDIFGDVLVALGKLYNYALLAWEINGPGRSLALQIVRKHRYRNVYMRDDLDYVTKRMTKKPGWRTTSKTKPYMVSISQRYVRQQEIEIFDSSTLQEMRSFARVGENQYEAARGHDDRVIGLCGLLAVVDPMIQLLKRKYEQDKLDSRPKEKMDPDRDFFNPQNQEDENWNPILGDVW